MCGLVGYLGGLSSTACEVTLSRMTESLAHRGPNGFGVWLDNDKRIGLGHRRLAIVDLTSAGYQPMRSSIGRYVIVFNGEIYNHQDLRLELGMLHWRGHSDTETLLAAIEAWGLEETLKKANGMFAIALWDSHEQTLKLARDRVGEKPLFYGWQGSGSDRVFLFGSELKALKLHPAFKSEINRSSIALLLRHNYIPAPYSIYDGISKLEPGNILSVSLHEPAPKVSKYWDLLDVVQAGLNKPFSGTANDAVDSLNILARDAVSKQMVSDVPLGAFLSGGVDSSLVVSLMQNQSSRPIQTFTIGFAENGYDEALHAKAVASHLGTNHTELYVSAMDAMNVIPNLPSLYCEPFADSSQIPTFLLSQLAKKHVTVSLSGDAGDELFCGYNRYQIANNLWGKLSKIPNSLRHFSAKVILSLSPNKWDSLACFIPGANSYANFGDKLHKGADALLSKSEKELYLRLISLQIRPEDFVIGGKEQPTRLTQQSPFLDGLGMVDRMMALDMLSYLPDDILVKVDRASMGASLECRAPFLDYRLVEFAWSLPLDYKLRNGQTKWPLRQLLYRYVPLDLIERPKMGFGVPLHDWLRGPLKDWAEALLDSARIDQEGYLYSAPIRQMWLEHLTGSRNWANQLWCVLMFQSWLERERA
jgi:asparagine synthase (glutamine-hydrolysing)